VIDSIVSVRPHVFSESSNDSWKVYIQKLFILGFQTNENIKFAVKCMDLCPSQFPSQTLFFHRKSVRMILRAVNTGTISKQPSNGICYFITYRLFYFNLCQYGRDGKESGELSR
jgi:hypothetical protein